MAETTLVLAGSFDLSIDPKSRLSVPFAIREKLHPDRDGHSFYVLPGRQHGTLTLYPEKQYERWQAGLPSDDALSDQAYAYRQFESAHTVFMRSDSQGRILIPDALLKRVGIDKEVTLVALRDHLELWPRERFRAFADAMWPEQARHRSKAFEEIQRLKTGAEGKPAAAQAS